MGKPTGFLDYERENNKSVEPLERIKNFNEFHSPMQKAERQKQGARCMNCGVPFCQSAMKLGGMVSGCPLHNLIPEWNDEIYNGNWEYALARLTKTASFPEFTGRVCPALCEAACSCGLYGSSVTVKENELAIIEEGYKNGWMKPHPPEVRTGKRVAVVGSGPSGLTCAGDLAKKGYKVAVFEALHTAGGVLVYGIPEFRLPKAIVKKEVDTLKQLGVEIDTNVIIGKTVTVDELFDMGYEAVFIGSGAGLPRFMGIEGEALCGVYSANEFLTRNNLMKAYKDGSATPVMHAKKAVIVGGGNVAMDAARTAKRLGADVTVVYRRTENELPARREEVEHAMEEGIEFKFLTNPIKIEGEDGWVKSILCQEMKLSEPDESGRARPVPVEGSEYEVEADCVIMSIGTSPNPLIKSTTSGLEVNKRGGIIVNEETGKTSRDGVYAGGDAVTGAATVILAMGAGKTAAKAIDEYIMQK